MTYESEQHESAESLLEENNGGQDQESELLFCGEREEGQTSALETAQAELLNDFPEEQPTLSQEISAEFTSPIFVPKAQTKGRYLRGVVAGISLALGGLGFAGAGEAQEPVRVASMQDAKYVKKENTSSAYELESRVKNHVSGLDVFAKMDLVNDIKNNADQIRTVLANGDFGDAKARELLQLSGKNLRPILEIYFHGLSKLKQENAAEFQVTKAKLEQLIHRVQTRSLSELKKEFS